MLHQVRIAMANKEIEQLFEAVVEVDETYVGGKPRKTNAVLDKEGRKLSGRQLLRIIETTCKKGTIVNTDEFKSYGILNNKENREKYIHVTVNHKKGQYVKGNTYTNGIENFWSIVKNGIRGAYHHISIKYLQRYVDEFCFRQNTRLDKNMFDILLGQCILV
jgi:transposase-like protein